MVFIITFVVSINDKRIMKTLRQADYAELTNEQLTNQFDAIQTARFLMANIYNASEETQSELMKALNSLDLEMSRRGLL